jgi:crossover junction endodeoxyribonuclease RusA
VTALLTVALPWPPSTNNLYVNAPRGRVLCQTARLWKADALDRVAMTGRLQQTVIPAGDLALTLALHPPSARRRFDVDGKIKLLQDAVCLGLGIDDSRIAALHVTRADVVPNGSVTVTLATLEGVTG